MALLTKYLGWICGQAADRSWVFGSEMFPLCERCTGIYAGAAIAMAMFCGVRPRPRRWSLLAYTLLILQIVPAGLHWWLNTPALRTLSGAWFGVGLIGLLYRQAMPDRYQRDKREWPVVLSSFLLVTAMTPLAEDNTMLTKSLLALLVVTGLFSIAVLIALNVFRLAFHYHSSTRTSTAPVLSGKNASADLSSIR